MCSSLHASALRHQSAVIARPGPGYPEFVKRFAIAALGLVLAIGQPTLGQPEAIGIIGVVEVPKLFGSYASDGAAIPPDRRGVQLRGRPSANSRVVARVTTREALEVVEFQYEQDGAVVFARERDWSLVRTRGGVDGWLAPADAAAFHSLQELLEGSLAFLTSAWNGRLHTSPGVADEIGVPGDPDRRLLGYIEPDVPDVRVVLSPGQDPEEIRRTYRPTGMSGTAGPNGTRILFLETGIAVPVFEAPYTRSKVVSTIETNRADEGLQTTRQMPPQVLVFASQPGWFQVALENHGEWRSAKRVWLQDSPIWRFHDAASDAAQKELAERAWGPESRDVRIVGFRTIAGSLWSEVEVVNESECSSASPPRVRARGWVPAHAPSGALNLWYYPRGC
jgi:hypothetical protein